MFTPGFGYDRAITIFSPDGRLFQVEYALEAVKRGTTAVGVRCPEGVVLAVEKRIVPLQESVEKIFIIDDHIGTAIAGLTSDARILVAEARLQAQLNKLNYDAPIPVEILTKKIGDLKQLYTQHAGVRPFGVALLIAGVDDYGPHLYVTDPSGTYWGYKATAIGAGASSAMEVLEKEYKDNLDIDSATLLALKSLKKAMGSEFDPKKVEVAVALMKTKKFEKLSPEEVEKYFQKLGE